MAARSDDRADECGCGNGVEKTGQSLFLFFGKPHAEGSDFENRKNFFHGLYSDSFTPPHATILDSCSLLSQQTPKGGRIGPPRGFAPPHFVWLPRASPSTQGLTQQPVDQGEKVSNPVPDFICNLLQGSRGEGAKRTGAATAPVAVVHGVGRQAGRAANPVGNGVPNPLLDRVLEEPFFAKQQKS